MKSVLALFVLLLGSQLVTVSSRGEAKPIPVKPDESYQQASSGMVFPSQVGSFARVSLYAYDDARADVSGGYNDRAVKTVLTVYCYPTAARAPFEEEVKIVSAQIEQTSPGAKQVSAAKRTVKQGDRSLEARELVYEMKREFNGAMTEVRSRAILLTVGKNVIKYRITYPVSEATEAEKRIESFLGAFALPADK